MKKIILFLLSALVFGTACDPLVDDKSIGGVVSESELDITVRSTSEGSNEILLENNTPGVGSYWDYIVNKSTKQSDVVRLPFVGELTITFVGLCDGGTVTTTRKVNVTKIDKEVEKEWTMLAGSDINGKVWVWADGDEVYGSGGYGNSYAPAWSLVSKADMLGTKGEGSDYEMLFDLNGGANFTKRSADGKVLETGSFKFDMTKQKYKEDGRIWSIGQLEVLDATVLCGTSRWGSTPLHTFDILTLTDDEMILGWAAEGTTFETWGDGDATFWSFKKK